jgi:mRNA interferase MazF
MHNGLTAQSQVMVDKIVTIRRDNLGQRIGALETAVLLAVERAVLVFLGLAR